MNQLFNYEGHEVRTVLVEGEPWFVAKDVCDILRLTNTNVALGGLDDDEKCEHKDYLGSGRKPLLVNESGLYSLILRSRKPEARIFKRWVTSEVLPAIRKHGGYLTQEKVEEALLNPDTLIQLATQLKQEREERIAAEATIAAQAPKVLFADSVAGSDTSITIGDMAKILRQNGVDTGQNRFYTWLRDNGYLIKRYGKSYNMLHSEVWTLDCSRLGRR